jgi:hypothetical protein
MMLASVLVAACLPLPLAANATIRPDCLYEVAIEAAGAKALSLADNAI